MNIKCVNSFSPIESVFNNVYEVVMNFFPHVVYIIVYSTI